MYKLPIFARVSFLFKYYGELLIIVLRASIRKKVEASKIKLEVELPIMSEPFCERFMNETNQKFRNVA